MSPRYYIGTSGWHYEHWRGNFYPESLPKKEWLSFYGGYFDSVEINSSFYRLPQEHVFAGWRDSVPAGFCFAVKGSRFITHIIRLKDSRKPLDTFIQRAGQLKNKLGPLLFQLPPGLNRDDARLESFLAELISLQGDLRHVIEFRHKSWMDEEVFGMLRRYRVGFCIFDMPGFISPVVATADFAYVRFHGHDDKYSGCYPDSDLAEWAAKIKGLKTLVNTVYIYFNNDAGGFAIQNAQTLREYLRRQ
jgi:uncharacterized protein YecE (DUF72 family)